MPCAVIDVALWTEEMRDPVKSSGYLHFFKNWDALASCYLAKCEMVRVSNSPGIGRITLIKCS